MSASAELSSRKPLDWTWAPWQPRHLLRKIGSISRVKSTFRDTGGGSLADSAAKETVTANETVTKDKRTRNLESNRFLPGLPQLRDLPGQEPDRFQPDLLRAACKIVQPRTDSRRVASRRVTFISASGPAARAPRLHTRTPFTTFPATSVRRNRLPWNLNTSLVWSTPRHRKIVALRSWTWTGSRATL